MRIYLAFGTETTLFHTSLDMVVSEVGLLTSPGYSMIFLPTVNLVRLGFSFCGVLSTTLQAYIIYFLHSLEILLQSMKKLMSFPLTLFPTPCANLPISFSNNCFQTLLCWSYLIRCIFSIDAPALGSIMELAIFFSCPEEIIPSNGK